MKKILFFATSNIFLPSGGGLANRALLKALEEEYPNRVDVVHPEVKNEVPSNFYLVPDYTGKEKIKGLLKGRVHKYNPWLLNFIDQHKGEYSHCLINSGLLGDLVKDVQARGIKVCMIHHNYEVEFQTDNRSMPAFRGYFPYFISRNERRAYLHADLNLFLTNSDMETFRRVYGDTRKENNTVIGIFEDEDRSFDYVKEKKLPVRNLVICGSLNSVQTLRGMEQFATNCLPILHRYFNEDFSLLLTGRNPHEFIRKLADSDKQIHLVANPENMIETIIDSGIFICPTNVGGGVKLRIMDGLKLGMPIIAHRVSARGYDAFLGKPWFQVYDDKDSFNDALLKIIEVIGENRELRKEIIENYRQYFSFPKGKTRFLSSIKSFLS